MSCLIQCKFNINDVSAKVSELWLATVKFDKVCDKIFFDKMTQAMEQPNLFETNSANSLDEKVLLYALGDFQDRGFELIGRKLPLDRLLGAFKRAFEKFDVKEISDEKLAETLSKLGAKVEKVPSYVAKHPFRVTVFKELAERSLEFYQLENTDNHSKSSNE